MKIQLLALKNRIFLYHSSFVNQTSKRELHIFLYLHVYLSRSRSVVPYLKKRGGKPASPGPQRYCRRKNKEKEANSLLSVWVSGKEMPRGLF